MHCWLLLIVILACFTADTFAKGGRGAAAGVSVEVEAVGEESVRDEAMEEEENVVTMEVSCC